jgi:hypothetical protein
LCRKIADIYLADKFTEEKPPNEDPESKTPVTLTPRELKNKTGKYADKKESFIADISFEQGTLIVEAMGISFSLIPISQSKFISKDAPADIAVEFFPAEGEAMRANLTIGGEQEVGLSKMPAIAPLTPEQLKVYAGTYHNDELPATYILVVDEGKLLFKHRNAPEGPLKLIDKDKFISGYGKMEFIRGRGKKTVGFYLDAGRVRIRFKKD